MAEELGGINYDWQLAGPSGGSEYNFSVVPALLTVYLLHELKVPGRALKIQQELNRHGYESDGAVMVLVKSYMHKCDKQGVKGGEHHSL